MSRKNDFSSDKFSFSSFEEKLICKESFLKWLDENQPFSSGGGSKKYLLFKWMCDANTRQSVEYGNNDSYEVWFLIEGGKYIEFGKHSPKHLPKFDFKKSSFYKIAEAVYKGPRKDSLKGEFYITRPSEISSAPNFIK